MAERVANETEEILQAEVRDMIALEQELQQTELELMSDPRFQEFLVKKRNLDQQMSTFWKGVEAQMITHDIKQIKGDWGTLTIAERLDWDINEAELPRGFKKLVPDTKKLSDHYRLTGKQQKGASPRISKYLSKRFK